MPNEGVKDQSEAGVKAEGEAGDAARMVPLDALEAERSKRQTLETQLAELRGRVDGLSQGQSQRVEEKEFSRADLSRAVDDGKMSQAEADTIYEKQLERRLEKKAEETVSRKVDQTSKTSRIQGEIDRFKEAVPAVMEEGTPERKKVSDEYNYLVSLGYPASLETEAAALRSAFGPAEGLVKGRPSLESHQETGGGGSGGGENRTDGIPKGLTKDQRDFYSVQIQKGFYSGWDDKKLTEELKYIKKPRKAA